MRVVERLLTAGAVEIREVDPEHAGRAAVPARRTSRSSVGSLRRPRSTRLAGSTAEPHEVRPPRGVFLVAYLRGTPMGCGALKHFD